MVNPLLQTWLLPLQPFLQHHDGEYPDLVEISAISPGVLHLETVGGGYVEHPAPDFDLSYWETLCHVLANHYGLIFDIIHQPRLSVMLPGGHRFEAMMGSSVETGLSVSIRIRRSTTYTFGDFGLGQGPADMFMDLLERGANILISGGTSSGKTTFMNHLLPLIPLERRLLVVEDTRELFVPHPNHVHYLVSRNEEKPVMDYAKMIDHLMRSRPDMIIMGELSMTNAWPILRLLNTGHGGFMCTLHANSPESALSWAIPQNVAFAGHDLSGVGEFLEGAVDVVVQLHRHGDGRRGATEIFFPKTGKRMNALGEPL